MQKWGRTRDCDEKASNVHVLQTEFFMRHLFRPTHDKIATFQLEICKPAKQGMKAQWTQESVSISRLITKMHFLLREQNKAAASKIQIDLSRHRRYNL